MIIKPKFDFMHVKKLKEMTDDSNKCRVGAIVMEEGLAHLFLLGSNTSKLMGKIEKRISKKKAFVAQHQKQTEKFFQSILDCMMAKYDLFKLEAMVVGSPGFIKEAFMKFLRSKVGAAKQDALKNNIDKFIEVHVSSGFKHSVQEIMTNRSV